MGNCWAHHAVGGAETTGPIGVPPWRLSHCHYAAQTWEWCPIKPFILPKIQQTYTLPYMGCLFCLPTKGLPMPLILLHKHGASCPSSSPGSTSFLWKPSSRCLPSKLCAYSEAPRTHNPELWQTQASGATHPIFTVGFRQHC